VKVTTASELSEEMNKEITGIMTKYTKATVELNGKVDPAVIGGFALTWKDKKYDATLSHQIEKLKREVAKINLYVKQI
jgi:F-type H+-transporting ATPase subunit delta